MAPRKSTSRSSRPSQPSTSTSATISKQSLPSSIPPLDLPETLTPEYVPRVRVRGTLNEEDRLRLVQELIGFHPRSLLDDISEHARLNIYATVQGIEGWAGGKSSGLGEAVEREVDIGLHSLETLLESHIDKAFDKFTAWALRNAFEVPSDLEVVLPWHQNLDFARGEYVASLPKGEDTLVETIEELREKVEQARLLSQQLERAEKTLDRRLEVAKQRKSEIGFVQEVLKSSGLSPLPSKASQIQQSLLDLHKTLSPLEITHPTQSTVPNTTNHKAWELGRMAYLNWAVNKMVPNSLSGSNIDENRISELERQMMESKGGMEVLRGSVWG